MRVIITGGTGLIGRPLAASLVADGHDVIVLSRNPIEVTPPMPDGVSLHRWDAKTSEGWGELVNNTDAIINLAGASIGGELTSLPGSTVGAILSMPVSMFRSRWSADRKKLIRESRIQAGHAVVEAVRNATNKPKVVIQSSAVGYYGGETGDEVVTESHSPGSDFLAKVCFDWEISTAPLSRMGIRRPIIRTAGMVMSNFGGTFPLLKLPYNMYAGGKLGDGQQWLSWMHIADEVKAIRFLLEHDAADGPFNLSAPNPVRYAELCQGIGRRHGCRPSRRLRLPWRRFGRVATVVLDGQREGESSRSGWRNWASRGSIPPLRRALARGRTSRACGAGLQHKRSTPTSSSSTRRCTTCALSTAAPRAWAPSRRRR
ncbi:MAG: NAD-dependent epimerase/dehydratase family protein [Caldilineaceae bacterium]